MSRNNKSQVYFTNETQSHCLLHLDIADVLPDPKEIFCVHIIAFAMCERRYTRPKLKNGAPLMKDEFLALHCVPISVPLSRKTRHKL